MHDLPEAERTKANDARYVSINHYRLAISTVISRNRMMQSCRLIALALRVGEQRI